MTDPLLRIADRENLYWAWKKVYFHYTKWIEWYDPGELAAFELDLQSNLERLSKRIQQGYIPSVIRPRAIPKRSGDGELASRQWFRVDLNDQIAWVALVNAVGPQLEELMQPWSLGNRLYRPCWYESQSRRLMRGPFRNSSGHVFKKFQHSWPLYRRLVLRTAQRLAGPGAFVIPEDEQRLDVPDHSLPYLDESYPWKERGEVYRADMDLEKFYAKLHLPRAIDEFCSLLPPGWDTVGEFVRRLSLFQISYRDCTDGELDTIDLGNRPSTFEHLPTGLIVAGFLANVAMIRVDSEANERLRTGGVVAQFRYVDDHALLATGFDELVSWIYEYAEILANSGLGVALNWQKFEPAALRAYLVDDSAGTARLRPRSSLVEQNQVAAERYCRVDPAEPTPLMTTTLGRVSALAGMNFDLLDPNEQQNALQELRHLLLADLPDTELKRATRVTFAASMIARHAGRIEVDGSKLVRIYRELVAEEHIRHDLAQRVDQLRAWTDSTDEHYRDTAVAKLVAVSNDWDVSNARAIRLRRAYETARSKKRKEQKEIWDHAQDLLVLAIRRHPERWRVWDQALRFCLLTGSPIRKKVRMELDRVLTENPALRPHLQARMRLSVAVQILRAINVVLDDNQLPAKRKAAYDFAMRLVWRPLVPLSMVPTTDDDRASNAALQWAISTLYLLVRKGRIARQRGWMYVPSNAAFEQSIGAAGDEQPSSHGARRSSVWAWWVETNVSALGEADDQVYSSLSGVLDYEKRLDLQFAQLRPNLLSASRFAELARKTSSGINRGWIWDVRASRHSTSVNFKSRRFLTLFEWTQFVRSLHVSNPYDPRTGEWFALALLQKCFPILRSFTMSPSAIFPISPHNISLGSSLTDQERVWTWEDARRELGTIKVKASPSKVMDRRYSLGQFDDEAAGQIQGAGMLLFGLLRRSFVWPGRWNVAGQERVWLDLVRDQIRKTPCSTYSLWILEACLSSRSRETMALQKSLFQFRLGLSDSTAVIQGDPDWENDPTPILNLDSLEVRVAGALKKLEELQTSVLLHRPRQLIPLRIGRLSSAELRDPSDEEALDEGS